MDYHDFKAEHREKYSEEFGDASVQRHESDDDDRGEHSGQDHANHAAHLALQLSRHAAQASKKTTGLRQINGESQSAVHAASRAVDAPMLSSWHDKARDIHERVASSHKNLGDFEHKNARLAHEAAAAAHKSASYSKRFE